MSASFVGSGRSSRARSRSTLGRGVPDASRSATVWSCSTSPTSSRYPWPGDSRNAVSDRIHHVAVPWPRLGAAVALDRGAARPGHVAEESGVDAQDAGFEHAGEGVVVEAADGVVT